MNSKYKSCIIIGGGESLRNFNFAQLKNEMGNKLPIFAPNDTFIELYKKGIKVDYLVFWDMPWYQKREEIVKEFFENGTEIHTIDRYDLKNYNEWTVDSCIDLSRKPKHIGNMNSTLAMMINVALHKGFTNIYLLGFDNHVKEYEHWYDTSQLTNERKKILHDIFILFDKFMAQIALSLTKQERIIQIGNGFEYFESLTQENFEKWLMKIK